MTPASSLREESSHTVLTVALSQPPVSLDPADHRSRISETVIRNIFDGLVTRDTRSGVHLELAEEILWRDETTLAIKLREGVRFHDGVELTAADVVFTFERILAENGIEFPEPHTSPRRNLLGPLDRLEQVDRYRLLMYFRTPWPSAMQYLVHQQIVPKHYLDEVGTEGFLAHPIGTGPFQFVSAQADYRTIVLQRFTDYYGGAPTLPPVGGACVEEVVFRVIADPNTRAAALRVGEVDIVQAVPLDLIDVLRESPGLQIMTAPGTRPLWIDLNVEDSRFSDARTRRALNYAIDIDALIAGVFDGRAMALPGPLSPYNNFVTQTLRPYPYDLARALDLLAAAGWVEPSNFNTMEEGGVQSISPVVRATLSLTLDTLSEWLPVAEAVADQLASIGVEVDIRLWDQDVIEPLLLAGERSAFLGGWGDAAFDPIGHIEAKWYTREQGGVYGRANYSGYSNPRVDELIRMGENSVDTDERQDIYNEVQQIIYQEAPAIFLVLPEVVGAATTNVLNWEPASDGRINLHDVCLQLVPAGD
jgi:peptide/nickel transport system substrate-binding protein